MAERISVKIQLQLILFIVVFILIITSRATLLRFLQSHIRSPVVKLYVQFISL